jgi:hypothetical protein
MTAAPPTAAELVVMAGGALYGVDWQARMARDLNVQLRTVQRIAQAAREGRDYPAARAWLPDLAGLAEARRAELAALRALLLRPPT